MFQRSMKCWVKRGTVLVIVSAIVVVWTNVPLVPVTVMVALPSVAVEAAVNVSTLLAPVAGDGLKLAVTPVGMPLAASVTAPANPPVRVIAIVEAPLMPKAMERVAGDAESEKSGGVTGFIVNAITTVCVSDPLVPVTVTFVVPVVAVEDADRVSTVLVPVVLVGLNVAVTPDGSALFVNATEPAKPPVRVMVTVLVPLAP